MLQARGATLSAPTTHVLLVEDNPDDVDLFRRTLEKVTWTRFVLESVSHLGAALARASGPRVDVIVLDLGLPDGHGLAMLERLAAAVGATPIVVMTGNQDAQVALRALEMGAQDFVVKGSVDGEELARCLLYAIERRRWLDRLERSESQLEEAQAISHVGSWEWDIAAGQLTLSRELSRIFGVGEARSSMSVERFLAHLHPEDRAVIAGHMQSSSSTGELPASYEHRFVRDDGETRWLIARARVHGVDGDDGDKVRRIFGTTQDVTERKQLETHLLVAGRMAAVGSLASGAAHGINNPLSAVLGNLEYLSGRLADVRAGRALGAAEVAELELAVTDGLAGAQRIKDVVKNLMVFMGAADSDRRAAMNVRQLLQASLDIVGHGIRHRARVIEQYEDVPAVDGNGARLSQVFVQLLLNAVQAIPEGAPERHEIAVRTYRDAEGLVVAEVRDTGCGIAHEHLSRIFDPFFTTRPLGTATGLGLSTAHAIVTSLGGSIVVESEVGKGSTFRVKLPAAKVSARRAPEPRVAAAVGVPRVLVVDDEPAVAAMLRRLLAASFQVLVETDARVALDRVLAGEPVDVILCDVMMPGMGGVDFYEELARRSPEQARRTVFITGGAFTARAQEFLERVPNPRLRKPFARDALLEAIRACLR